MLQCSVSRQQMWALLALSFLVSAPATSLKYLSKKKKSTASSKKAKSKLTEPSVSSSSSSSPPQFPRELPCREDNSCGDTCGHSDFWKRFGEFRRHKRHDAAVLLGNGPSANLLGETEGPLMMAVADIWATNQFFVHKYVTPDYHHIEVKGYTERFWMDNFTPEIKERYDQRGTQVWSLIRDMKNDAKEICRNGRVTVRSFKSCSSDCGFCSQRVLNMTGRPQFVYGLDSMLTEAQVESRAAGNPVNYRKVLERTSKCSVQKTTTVDECALGKHCYASMTTVMDMLVRMGYRRVYVLGVDLNDHRHFYNAAGDAATYAHLKLPRTMNETDSSAGVHKTATMGVQDFLPAFFKKFHVHAFNLSPTSLLRSKMPTLDVRSAVALEQEKGKGKRSQNARL
jgi:hypothetical protein